MSNQVLSPKEILQATVETGKYKAEMPIIKQFMLGIIAGAFIALAGAGANVAAAYFYLNQYQDGLARFVSGLIFPAGLMMVLLAGSQLFTGNSLLITTVLDRKLKVSRMLLNWLVVYLGNFVGALLIALLVFAGGQFDFMEGAVGFVAVNSVIKKLSMPFLKAFSLGILCNFLVCIAVWLATGAKEMAGKIWATFFPIMLFVVSGYEHSVANMYYIPAGILQATKPEMQEYLGDSISMLTNPSVPEILYKSFLPVTLGNIVGGALFVGVVYWLIYREKPVAAIAENVESAGNVECAEDIECTEVVEKIEGFSEMVEVQECMETECQDSETK